MRFRKTVIAAVLVGVTGGVVAAQSETPTNPNILAAINALRADLTTAFNSVLTALQNIQKALQGLISAVSNVANTPFIG